MKRHPEQRKKVLTFRASALEATTIRKLAAEEKLPVSEFIREKVLQGTDSVSIKRQQAYFAERMKVAEEFRTVKEAIRQNGYAVNLEPLERGIFQSCL